MKWWLVSLAVWYTAMAGLLFWAQEVKSDQKAAPKVDWERVAMCLFERYDNAVSFEEQGRVLRFCVEVEPHSLP